MPTSPHSPVAKTLRDDESRRRVTVHVNRGGGAADAPLTCQQRRFLKAIYRHLRDHQRPPKFRELHRLVFGPGKPFAANAVMCHIKALERRGIVERKGRHNEACNVRLVGLVGFALPGLPVFESSPAGVRLMSELFRKGD